MKKMFLILLALMFAAGMSVALVGCGGTTGEQQEEEEEVIELNFSITASEQSSSGPGYTAWAQGIEDASNGAVKVNMFWSNSLLQVPEVVEGVKTGIADIAMYPLGGEAATYFPLSDVTTLHFLPNTDMEAATYSFRTLMEEYPVIEEEFTDQGILPTCWYMMTPIALHTVGDFAPRVPDDVAGHTIICSGRALADAVEGGGGASLDLTVGDWYVTLERGLAEGLVTNTVAANIFVGIDFFSHVIHFGSGGCAGMCMVMLFNEDSWNSLSTEVQTWINNNKWSSFIDDKLVVQAADELAQLEHCEETGIEIIELTPDEIAEWAAYYVDEHAEWIADMNALGYPGQEIYDRYMELLSAYAG